MYVSDSVSLMMSLLHNVGMAVFPGLLIIYILVLIRIIIGAIIIFISNGMLATSKSYVCTCII